MGNGWLFTLSALLLGFFCVGCRGGTRLEGRLSTSKQTIVQYHYLCVSSHVSWMCWCVCACMEGSKSIMNVYNRAINLSLQICFTRSENAPVPHNTLPSPSTSSHFRSSTFLSPPPFSPSPRPLTTPSPSTSTAPPAPFKYRGPGRCTVSK